MKKFETLLPMGFHPDFGKTLKSSLKEANVKFFFEENIFGGYSLIVLLPEDNAKDGTFMFHFGRMIGGSIAIDVSRM